MPKFSTKTLTTMALLTALEIVLSRFLSISAWNTKIGFAFVPVALAAMLFGPVYAGIVAALLSLAGLVVTLYGHFAVGMEGKTKWTLGVILNVVVFAACVALYVVGLVV